MDYPKNVPGVGLVNGKFADEDAASGRIGSLIPAEWGNAVTDEHINVLRAAGLEPDETSVTQLLEAIKVLSASGETMPPEDDSDHWATTKFVHEVVSRAVPNRVGEIVFEMRVQPRLGWLKLNGALLQRADYADLWAYAQASGAIVAEKDWPNNWWGAFSSGDGATTFRIPDLRGTFLRVWDDTRGLDAGRNIGAFQGTANASHAHGASAAAVGDHVHGAWTDAQGQHSHTGVTGGVGDHGHGVGDPGHAHGTTVPHGGGGGGERAVIGPFGVDGFYTTEGAGTGIWIAAAGAHNHGIGADGNHGHNVSIGGAGNHSHTITIAADGANESRPVNVAVSAFIRAY